MPTVYWYDDITITHALYIIGEKFISGLFKELGSKGLALHANGRIAGYWTANDCERHAAWRAVRSHLTDGGTL